ncbi:ATP-binding protein [Paraclostridium ghonii]|uniref:sensor histidine kinase n=1 Tax=Paraclostridium ghonii TaxID=29358 RepID=UPI00202CFF6A|nr:ATP-binding protein [Paeniclostridium ghonii]MCM0167602.1 ATP-binding protein [Paeniclostridium ghonii]
MKDSTKYLINIYKSIFMELIYILISFTISNILCTTLYTIWSALQNKESVFWIAHLLRSIKNGRFGTLLYYMIPVIFTVLIYIKITYKRYKKIALLMESIESMADGDLEKNIENIDSNDIFGEVYKNINRIIERLKNITVEERKAQQTKTDLITNVSHDLRTPLTSIIGYLNLIEDDKYKDEVHLKYYTKIAYEKSKDLNVLINDLFELTKLQNKSLPLNKTDINLVELISQVITYLDGQLKNVNMKIRVDFSNDKLMINADSNKLVRVFENIISNATKYGNEGKYIDIITKRENDSAVVEIINYGETIPHSDIPFIFDRFYRVEKSRNKNSGGSGLGLAIAKNIIEIHDGNILAESNNSKTTFKISLPINKNL